MRFLRIHIPAPAIVGATHRRRVNRVRVWLGVGIREMLANLRQRSNRSACDGDAGSKDQRFLRRVEQAVPLQAPRWRPVNGPERSVVQSEKDMAVRLVVFDLFDFPLDRQRFAPVVGKRVAVVGVSGGRYGDNIHGHREDQSFHGTAHGIEPTLPVHYSGSKRAPGDKPGALACAAGSSLPAHLEAGSTTRGAVAGVTVGDHLDPECIVALVVGRGAGLAQRIQTVLRCTRGCGGESRQLEDHPRAAIQFIQGERHRRPFGCHLDLGTGSYVGAPSYGELLAVAAENDWRLRRSSRSAESTTRCATTGSARARSSGISGNSAGSDAGTSSCCAWTGSCASARTRTASAAETSAAAAKRQASDIALAHRSVPRGLDLTGLVVNCDAVVDAVVDEHVGIGTSAE